MSESGKSRRQARRLRALLSRRQGARRGMACEVMQARVRLVKARSRKNGG